LGVERQAGDLVLLKIIVAKSQDVETGRSNSQEWINLAKSSKEGYGSNTALLPMMMM
jgi:hypothetical protein